VLTLLPIAYLLTPSQLYFSDPDPRAGTEEPFPDPDNLQKMRRSMDNAETIGLFRPNTTLSITAGPSPNYGRRYTRRPFTFGRSRPGFYMPPARVGIQPPSNTPIRFRNALPSILTPPPTPFVGESMDSRSIVPLETEYDAFSDFTVIRQSRRIPSPFHCETQPHQIHSQSF
jgi:hypothetical protein